MTIGHTLTEDEAIAALIAGFQPSETLRAYSLPPKKVNKG